MPFGLVLLLIMIAVFVSGRGETALNAMALSVRGAVALLSAWILSYIVPPFYAEGIEAYWLPFLILLFYALFLAARLRRRFRTVSFAVLCTLLLYAFSSVVPVQPSGFVYEPLVIYTLANALFTLILAREEREAFFLSLVPLPLFQILLLFAGRLTVLMPASTVSSVVLSSALVLPPVHFLRTRRLIVYRRVFRAEAGKSFGKSKRNRFKK